MATSSIVNNVLQAEILSRKRGKEKSINVKNSDVVPVKKTRLNLKNRKKLPSDRSETTSAYDQTDNEDVRSSYSEIHSHMEAKSQIYDQLKNDPNARISNKLKDNLMLDTSKSTYKYKDEDGNERDMNVNELPPEFWRTVGSSDEEEIDDRKSMHGDYENSEYSHRTHHSHSESIVAYDGRGGSFIKPIDAVLGEQRHGNTMTEDRRDYGALYFNLKIGTERERRMNLLQELREETVRQRQNNDADSTSKEPWEFFTPKYANAYLQDLAAKHGKDLSEIKRYLYGHLSKDN